MSANTCSLEYSRIEYEYCYLGVASVLSRAQVQATEGPHPAELLDALAARSRALPAAQQLQVLALQQARLF